MPLDAAREIEVAMLQRYVQGEHEPVWRALQDARATGPEAQAVAREIMVRVRANLELLAERWREHGFTLAAPIGEPEVVRAALAAHEDTLGALPPTLAALYEIVGWVDFVASPPSEDWPEEEQLDPLQIEDPRPQIPELLAEEEPQLVLFSDPLTKMGYSGVGAIYVPLPADGFDAALWFEDGPLGWELVPYLRESILVRGGIGALTDEDALSSSLLKELTRDLQPF